MEFIRAKGQKLYCGNDEILLRGFGLGGWLLPEGYMWKLGEKCDRPRRMEALIEGLCGADYAQRFWQAYYAAYMTEDDVRRMADWGYNSMRLPLNARHLYKSEGAGCELLATGVSYIDACIDWGRKYGVYVILDMHGAPGGQTGQNIDDSEKDEPELFTDPEKRRELIWLWRALAERYKDEAAVAGYDLLNEPLPDWQKQYNDLLCPLYDEIIAAIRTVDDKHLIILEGAHWATDFSVFDDWTSPDENLMLQFHKYWSTPDKESLTPFLSARERMNIPIYMGEGGENTNDWYAQAFPLYESLNISWSFWPLIKMDNTNSPLSFPVPEGWGELIRHLDGKIVLTGEEATDIFDAFLAAIRQRMVNEAVLRALEGGDRYMPYPKNRVELTRELFENPGSEYRGAPFWAWNTELDKDELLWQIEQLKAMGFGGFHMHSRTGMATEYLGDSFMDCIKACVEKARSEQMLAWLYDEDRWPSGAAGGLVTKNPDYRARHLLLTRMPYAGDRQAEAVKSSSAISGRSGNGRLIACFDILLDAGGTLADYRQINNPDEPKGFVLYAYEETAQPSPWFNDQTYVDTLNPAAIRQFIETTYERYWETVGADFGGPVPAMFTDEPQFSHKSVLAYADDERDITLPWTTDFPASYQAAYGEGIVGRIPELLWDMPDGLPSIARYRYHDHLAERFAAAFADQCGAWCDKHGIFLTGHMMCEDGLGSQTATLGEAMRSYRSFGLPGIDMLCDWREFNTAKQAQSAARQYGRPGVLSELYGVTNWDFDFRGHKLQGDWQAALGVTVRVPHLSWVSMNGEAKRDYPASFNYQSPWYKEYSYIEDHYARINTAMTRGRALCRVAVIHPIESYWLRWGAQESTAATRRQMEENFENITKWLLGGCIDFDFICESLLPDQCAPEDISGSAFPVGAMAYDVVIVPELETIRGTTLERLEKYVDKGGRLIFLGSPPEYVEAIPDERGERLFARSERLHFNKHDIMEALAAVREIELRDQSGAMTENLIYQLREDGEQRWLFVAHADSPQNKDVVGGRIIRIKIRGSWAVTIYDTLSGKIRVHPAKAADGWTELEYPLYDHDSLLLKLCKGSGLSSAISPALVNPNEQGKIRFLHPVPVTLHEPNVALLDMAAYALDGGPWREREEILRLDNILRRQLAWPTREEAKAQPWVCQDAGTPHSLSLRFVFDSEISISGAELALENADKTTVTLNGELAGAVAGWYVDKCIGKVALPSIKSGKNVLELNMPYGQKTDVEACYLLGGFGVRVVGCQIVLTESVNELCFGDIVSQGLPFYGGNLTYHLEAETAGDFEISATCYRGHLLRVAVNEKDMGIIAFSPYRLKIKGIDTGKQKIDLTYFGSRVNTFGQLHRIDRHDPWWGPNSWRSMGDKWSYEYQLWPQGVLKSVEVFE